MSLQRSCGLEFSCGVSPLQFIKTQLPNTADYAFLVCRHRTQWRIWGTFIARLQVRLTSRLGQESQYLAPILSKIQLNAQPKLCTRLTKLVLEMKFYLDFIPLTELHHHADERSQPRVTSNTYFHGVLSETVNLVPFWGLSLHKLYPHLAFEGSWPFW